MKKEITNMKDSARAVREAKTDIGGIRNQLVEYSPGRAVNRLALWSENEIARIKNIASAVQLKSSVIVEIKLLARGRLAIFFNTPIAETSICYKDITTPAEAHKVLDFAGDLFKMSGEVYK